MDDKAQRRQQVQSHKCIGGSHNRPRLQDKEQGTMQVFKMRRGHAAGTAKSAKQRGHDAFMPTAGFISAAAVIGARPSRLWSGRLPVTVLVAG